MYAPYITAYLVISLPKIPYMHRMYVDLANPIYHPCTALATLRHVRFMLLSEAPFTQHSTPSSQCNAIGALPIGHWPSDLSAYICFLIGQSYHQYPTWSAPQLKNWSGYKKRVFKCSASFNSCAPPIVTHKHTHTHTQRYRHQQILWSKLTWSFGRFKERSYSSWLIHSGLFPFFFPPFFLGGILLQGCVCMCVCVCALCVHACVLRVRVWVCVCICACMRAWVCVCVCVCACVYVHVRVRVCMYLCTCTGACVSMSMCVCV